MVLIIGMLESTWHGGLERVLGFEKLKLKSTVTFFKYILLNKTSIPGARSKLLNMFKMT